jgi:hypothetical protein
MVIDFPAQHCQASLKIVTGNLSRIFRTSGMSRRVLEIHRRVKVMSGIARRAENRIFGALRLKLFLYFLYSARATHYSSWLFWRENLRKSL